MLFSISSDGPPYLGSWKGRVLKAIAVHDIRNWNGLLSHTQLTPDSLNTALSELYNLALISRNQEDGLYWIEDVTLYHQYRSFFENIDVSTEPLTHEDETVIQPTIPKDDDIAMGY